jgi:hypothetical protein
MIFLASLGCNGRFQVTLYSGLVAKVPSIHKMRRFGTPCSSSHPKLLCPYLHKLSVRPSILRRPIKRDSTDAEPWLGSDGQEIRETFSVPRCSKLAAPKSEDRANQFG